MAVAGGRRPPATGALGATDHRQTLGESTAMGGMKGPPGRGHTHFVRVTATGRGFRRHYHGDSGVRAFNSQKTVAKTKLLTRFHRSLTT